MQMRAMGPGAGWRWLMQGINLGRNNPKAIFGAAALLIVVALVPSLVQLVAQGMLGMTGMSVMWALLGFSLLYSLLVMPPMLGGFLRVVDACERGRETHAMAIFDVFKAGHGAPRMIALALLLALLAGVVFGLIFALFGPGVVGWYLQALGASQGMAPGTTPALPPLPEGFGLVVGLSVLVGLFLQGTYAVAFGQVSLTDRSVGGALTDGLVGALKNLLPLLVLLVIWVVFMFALVLVLGLLVALLAVIGGLVHPVMSLVLAAPVYFAFLLILYVIIIGVMYHLWRDVAGDDTAGGGKDNGVVAA